MKKLVILAIILMATTVWADDVSFLWDANNEVNLVGYRIYRSDIQGGPYVKMGGVACGAGDVACCTYTDLNVPDGTYFWVATAIDSYDQEGQYSAELTRTLPYVPIPNPPVQVQGFRFQ